MTAGSRCTLRFVSAIAVFLAAGALDTAAAASSGGQQFAQPAGIPGGAHSSARKLDGEYARFLPEGAADRLRRADGQFVLHTAFPPGQFGKLVKAAMQVHALYATVLDRWWASIPGPCWPAASTPCWYSKPESSRQGSFQSS